MTGAFLETLGARLPNDEAKDLDAQLPEELKEHLHPTAPVVEKMSADEFLTRFARSAELSNDRAGDISKAVWQAMEQSVSAGELNQVRSVLPQELSAALR